MKNKVLLIILVLCGIGMIGGGVYVGMSSSSQKESGNNKENKEEVKAETKEIKWGTNSPVPFKDKEYGQLEVVTYGEVSCNVKGELTEKLEEDVINTVISVMSSTIGKQKGKSYTSLAIALNKEEIIKEINKQLDKSKVEVVELKILAINLTEESKQKVNQCSNCEIDVMMPTSSLQNYRIKATSTMEMQGFTTTSTIEGVMDEKSQKEYLKTTTSTMGIDVVMETYSDFKTGYVYSSVPFTDTWEKAKGASMFVDLNSLMDKLDDNGDVTKVSENEYKIKLNSEEVQGLINSSDSTSSSQISGDIYAKAYTNGTYITKIEYDFSGLIEGMDKFTMVIEFSDFNNAGNVEIPSEVMN